MIDLPYGLTFAWPLVLLGLLALPLLLVVYAAHERRRGRSVARFANLALLPNLVARRPRWRRHVIPLVGMLALAGLVVGAARPQRAVTVERKQATVVLAIDGSRSMAATDVRPNRLEAAKKAARTLVAALPEDGRVGVVSFSRIVQTMNAPTDDRSVIDASLNGLTISGGTAVGDAIVRSLELVQNGQAGTESADGSKPPAAIVLLTDGASTEGSIGPIAAAKKAADAGVPVYTVSLGTSAGVVTDPATGQEIAVPPEPAALKQIADAAHGQSYAASDARQLTRIYDRIGRQVGTERRQQEMAAGFVGLSTVLLLIACALSLRWFGRLA